MNDTPHTEHLGNVQAFVNQYAPQSEAQRKAFWKKFRKAANAYAGIQGQRIADLEAELATLKRWKAEMLEVEKRWDPQEIGDLLGIPLGASIRTELKPRIEALKAELAAMTVMFDDAQRQQQQFFREARDVEKELEEMTAKRDSAIEQHRMSSVCREYKQQLAAMTVKRDALEYALVFCRDDLELELVERLPNPSKTWCSLVHAQEALATHGKASDATPNLEETRSKLGVENHKDHN